MALRWTTAVRSWRRAADANRATRRQRPPKWVCSRGIRCFGAGAGRPGLVVTDLSLVGLAMSTRDERRQTRKRPSGSNVLERPPYASTSTTADQRYVGDGISRGWQAHRPAS